MAGYVEVPIELDDDTYDAIVELIGSDDEDDIKAFIVKALTKFAENEGYNINNEYQFSEDE